MQAKLKGLPETEVELFMSQIWQDNPDQSWEEFWGEDFRWATCWQEEDEDEVFWVAIALDEGWEPNSESN